MKRENETTLNTVMWALAAAWWAGFLMLGLSAGSDVQGVAGVLGPLCFIAAYVGAPITAAIVSRRRGIGVGYLVAVFGLLAPGITLPILALWGRTASGPNLQVLREKQDLAGLAKALHYRRAAWVRSNAAYALVQAGGAQAESLLATAMGDRDSAARAAAAEGLGYLAKGDGVSLGQPAVSSLLGALQDPDAEVRIHAAWALGQLGGPQVEAPLSGLLNDPVALARRVAAQALGKAGSAAAMGPLARGLEDRAPEVRQYTAEALGRACLRLNEASVQASTVPLLVAKLKDGDAGVRKYAAEMLGLLGNPQALEPLLALLDDPAAEVRSGAALGLGQLKDPQAVDPLLKAMESPHPDLRRSAIAALRQIGDPRALPALTAAMQDGDAQVHQEAAATLPPADANAILHRITAGLKALGAELGLAAASASPQPTRRPATPAIWQDRRLWAAAAGVVLIGLVLLAVKLSRPMTPAEVDRPGPGKAQPTTAQVAAWPPAAPTRPALPPSAAPTRPPAAPAATLALPVGAAGSLQVTQVARQDYGAGALAWSPDGTLLYMANYQSRVYDVQAQKSIQQVEMAGGERATFSADRKMLAAPGSDGVVLWDVAGWSQIKALAGSKDTRAAAFSLDNALLFTQTGETVKVWDVATGQELRTIPVGHIDGIALSPDGRTLAIGGMSELRLVDAASGQEMRKLSGASGFMGQLVFSPDGTLLVAGGFGSDTIRSWDVARGLERRTIKPPAWAGALAFSPDGRLLAAGSGLYVMVWDMASGKELARLTGHSSEVKAVAFSPDGALLAAASGNELRIWQLSAATAAAPATAVPAGAPRPPASPVPLSSAAILPANAGRIAQVRTLKADSANRLAWSRDGQLLAVGASQSGVYDARTFEQTALLNASSPNGLAFSPDGKSLAIAASSSPDAKVWDATGAGELLTLVGSRDSGDVQYTPDGTLLLTRTGETVKVWDAATGQELRTIPVPLINGIAVSPDGRTLAVGGMSYVKLLDLASGKELFNLAGVSGFMGQLTFSPDGRLMAATGFGSDTVRFWDPSGGQQRRTIKLPADGNALTFSPDSQLLAVGSKTSVIVWEVATGKELRTLTGHTSDVAAVAFSPDGALLASAANDGVRFWGVGQ